MSRRPSWMIEDPAQAKCPAFSWYVPRYLNPHNHTVLGSESSRTGSSSTEYDYDFFPTILDSLVQPSSSTPSLCTLGARPPPRAPSSSGEALASVRHMPPHPTAKQTAEALKMALQALEEEQIARRQVLGVNWGSVTPLSELWNGPPIDPKVPPATDYTRLLARLTAPATGVTPLDPKEEAYKKNIVRCEQQE